MTHLAKAAAHTGVMVALFPSPATAGMLAQPGGEPAEDLHVTLAFLGDADQLDQAAVQRLAQTVAGWATTVAPLPAVISGTGRFTSGPEPVIYASVDTPDLPAARERLVEALSGAGLEPSSEHGFTPHMTLAYEDRYVVVPDPLPLTFETVTLAVAGERMSFPLTGVVKTGGGWMCEDCDWSGATETEAIGHSAATRHTTTPALPVAKAGSLSDAPWRGDASRFTDEQWRVSCLLDRGPSAGTAKQRYALPVREPSGAINRRALGAAAARLGQVQAHPEQIAAARRELRRLYTQAGLAVPSSIDAKKAEWDVPIWKGDVHQRIVYGVVLQPGVRDSQGDVVSAAEIEQAAHRYLRESRRQDLQHREEVAPVEPVESFIAPMDMVVADRPVLKGSWVMASQINDDAIWQQVLKDELTGYSIGGSGVRRAA